MKLNLTLTKSRLFLISLWLIMPSAWAATPSMYKVELIIFQYTNPQVDQNIAIPVEETNRDFSKAITLKPTDNMNQSTDPTFTLLPSKDFTLKKEVRALQRNQRYKVLVHEAWLQPANNGQTDLVHIVGGNSVGTGYQNYQEIDGTISVKMNRFFDIKTKLLLTEPTYNGLISYQLNQSRRMKSNELNYFDDPVFGMLLKIIPVETKTSS